MIVTVSNMELAHQFYLAHELEFQRAASAVVTEDRGFVFSGDRFDDWAFTAGHMTKKARDCGDSIERGGATDERNQLRKRINRAARAGLGLPRAFSVEANRGKWRVDLAERFLADRPREIVTGIESNHTLQESRIDLARKMFNEAEHLSDPERMLGLMRLDTVELCLFNGTQLFELAVRPLFDPSHQKLDLRRLRKRMTAVIHDVGARTRKRVTKQKV